LYRERFEFVAALPMEARMRSPILICRFLRPAWLLLVALGSLAPAAAQSFPPGPIRIVVPTAASTPPDIISRIIATELTETTGWRMVVENRPGGAMTIAGTDVLSQPADGTSIYAMSLPVAAAPSILPNVPFRLDRDFAPVGKVSVSYNVLVVTPSLPVKSASELVALLKQQPDKLTFSSGGFGTPAHLAGELFKLETGTRATHVPYQQFPQAIGDLLNGTNQFMFITMLPVIDLIKAGKLRALAVTAPERVPVLDEVPTVIEEGFPHLVIEDWVGFAVKSSTPDASVQRLNDAINQALKNPKVHDALAKLGAKPAGGTPAEYGAFVNEQVAYWGKVVKDAGLKLQP
jgi:tripartite-type tricarboxylate transporter receptor subunit TctC